MSCGDVHAEKTSTSESFRFRLPTFHDIALSGLGLKLINNKSSLRLDNRLVASLSSYALICVLLFVKESTHCHPILPTTTPIRPTCLAHVSTGSPCSRSPIPRISRSFWPFTSRCLLRRLRYVQYIHSYIGAES